MASMCACMCVRLCASVFVNHGDTVSASPAADAVSAADADWMALEFVL